MESRPQATISHKAVIGTSSLGRNSRVPAPCGARAARTLPKSSRGSNASGRIAPWFRQTRSEVAEGKRIEHERRAVGADDLDPPALARASDHRKLNSKRRRRPAQAVEPRIGRGRQDL